MNQPIPVPSVFVTTLVFTAGGVGGRGGSGEQIRPVGWVGLRIG